MSDFQVTVDGEQYADLEQFYTKEIQRLPVRLKDLGYDESYQVKLNAEVGFNDLWNNMEVYALAAGKNGYQARTFVDYVGGFSMLVPKSKDDNDFRIRAVKRISLIITKDKETKTFCYNFSAKENAVHFSEIDNPVILNNFVTDITSYDCHAADESGFYIPAR